MFNRVWLIGLCALALNAVASPEIYNWTDEEGNVHYSDCPPPPTCNAETVEVAPPPSEEDVRIARQRLATLLAEQESSQAVRQQERLEKERQHVEALRLAVERRRVCIGARQNLHVLQTRRPVYYIDQHGEYVYLDDEQRAAEIVRLEAVIAETGGAG